MRVVKSEYFRLFSWFVNDLIVSREMVFFSWIAISLVAVNCEKQVFNLSWTLILIVSSIIFDSFIAKYSEAKQMFLATHCPFEPDFLRYGQRQRKCIDWLNSQSFKRFFSPSRLLQQKAMITMENDIVAGDILLWLRGNSYDSSQFVLLFCPLNAPASAQKRTAIRAGSKMECVELCKFHFSCAFMFCHAIKQFELFGCVGLACTSLQPLFWFVLVNLHLFCC